jgi:hypothetical protein
VIRSLLVDGMTAGFGIEIEIGIGMAAAARRPFAT